MIKDVSDEEKELLKRLLTYNSETGVFTWNEDRRKARKGAIAGCVTKGTGKGKRAITINYKQYEESRLAWLFYYDKNPDGLVCHRDRDATNNKIENLYLGSRKTANRDMKKNITNTTGITGVSVTSTGKYQASIRVGKKLIYLGTFFDIDKATSARKRADEKYSFSETHGQNRIIK